MRVTRTAVLAAALLAAGVLSSGCLVVYLAMQQVERQGANDPQVQLAEDGAAALLRGATPADLAVGAPLDAAASLAPFVIVLDDDGRPVASQARLAGAIPVPPEGVLATARDRREDRVTWQPRPDVRLASVVRHVGGAHPGFIVAARSLREVEARIARIGQLLFVVWCLGIGAVALAALVALLAPRVATLRATPALTRS